MGLVAFDQATKWFFQTKYPRLVLINSGGAFSFLQGNLFYPFIVVVILLLLAIILIRSNLLTKNLVPVILIYAGAISDLIDRFRIGGVIDFLNLKFWPSFNFADMLIITGFIWFIFTNGFIFKNTTRKQN